MFDFGFVFCVGFFNNLELKLPAGGFPKNSFSESITCAFPFTGFVKVHY